MTQIKLCGMRREEDIRAVNQCKPQFCGVILSPGFRRSVTLEEARKLREVLDPEIRMAGVFVNASPEEIFEAVQEDVIDVIQLHGSEDVLYIDTLRKMLKDEGKEVPLIKAFKVVSSEDLERALQSNADIILLDNGTGTGETFDWKILGEIHRPWFLAGGLTAENVGEAIRQFAPTGVDISSAIETDGWKDAQKMKVFVEAVRAAQ